MNDKETLIKIISKSSSICDHWVAGQCYHPNGWRNTKLTKDEVEKLPDCICKPGNTEVLCDKCRPDALLIECKPELFKETVNEK